MVKILDSPPVYAPVIITVKKLSIAIIIISFFRVNLYIMYELI